MQYSTTFDLNYDEWNLARGNFSKSFRFHISNFWEWPMYCKKNGKFKRFDDFVRNSWVTEKSSLPKESIRVSEGCFWLTFHLELESSQPRILMATFQLEFWEAQIFTMEKWWVKSPFHHFHPPKIACLPGTRQTPWWFFVVPDPKVARCLRRSGCWTGGTICFFWRRWKKRSPWDTLR